MTIEGLVRAAAPELGARIRVNVVLPGWITETLQAVGMDPTPGVPAAEAALADGRQMESGASGSERPRARIISGACYHSCYRFDPQSGDNCGFTAFLRHRRALNQHQLCRMPALGPTPRRSKEMEDHLQKEEE